VPKQGYRAYLPSLKRRLRSGRPLFGLAVKMPGAAIVEMCARAGFDFAVIDTEHGGADGDGLEHHVRAAESFGMRVLVRVGSHAPIDILRALDIGAAGIVAPHVRTPAEAAGLVQAAYYPPLGSRGLATSTRAGDHSFLSLGTHLQEAAEQTVIVAQIEDQAALSHLDAIASTPGIDVIFVSPSDLSMSLGHPGEFAHPAVQAAMDVIVQAVRSAPHAVLGAFAQDERDAESWVERGAQFIWFSATSLVAQRFTQVIAALCSGEGDHEPTSTRCPPTEGDGARRPPA
jgi:4-hydroxy-2-oxoheptanedioate aldolase